jgi:TPR repeat protein
MSLKFQAVMFGLFALGAAASAPASASDIDDCNGAGGANWSTISAACTRIIQGPPSGALQTAYNNRGNASFAKGEHGRAIADYSRAIELDPADATAYFNRGRSFGITGQASQALADFSKAIELDPKLAVAYNSRGLAFAAQGDHDRALADYNKAIGLTPRDPLALANRARSLMSKGQFTQAIADLSEVTKISPKEANGFMIRGSAYLITREHARALADFGEAIRLRPGSGLYSLRGMARAEAGDVPNARADFEAALKLPDENTHSGTAHSRARDELAKLGGTAGNTPRDAQSKTTLSGEPAKKQQSEAGASVVDKAALIDPPVHDCDRLAGSPWDKRLLGGVSFDELDSKHAIPICKAAVAAYPSSARLQANLGRALHKGRIFAEARLWAEKAANHGEPSGMMLLGLLHDDGSHEGPRDYHVARNFYEQAAAKGDAAAMHLLGILYDEGQSVARDEAVALEWYRLAASSGNFSAIDRLKNYDKPKIDTDLVFSWYKIAASRGSLAAIRELAEHTPPEYETAREYFESAATTGDRWAMFKLAEACFEGKGGTVDHLAALRWLNKSADLGHAQAMNTLGELYLAGVGVKADRILARSWFERAAAHGLPGRENGLRQAAAGTPRDPDDDEALRRGYSLAAKGGDVDAMVDLAELLREKNHGLSDIEALGWLRIAKEKGSVAANQNLARLLAVGSRGSTGVMPDQEMAATLIFEDIALRRYRYMFAEVEGYPLGVRKKLQELLAKAGHYNGVIDGAIGPHTEEALKRLCKCGHSGGHGGAMSDDDFEAMLRGLPSRRIVR